MDFQQMLVSNAEFLKPFAITLTRDTEDARDLCQETLFRAIANEDKYHQGTNIKAWMYTIMRNIFINNYRKKVKQRIILDGGESGSILDRLVTENSAEQSLRLKDIHREINRVPVLFREPFQLYFEGYKYHEIADMLDEPLGTIKSRIHFARKLLKQQVESLN